MTARIAILVAFALAVLPPPEPALSQPLKVTTDRLAAESDVIVVGRVASLRSEWTRDSSAIRTVVGIRVEEALKGSVAGGELTVVIPGGEVGDVGEWYSHSVRFAGDEEVVVFARKGADGILRVTGGERGKFLVKEGERAGSRIIPNVGSLESFTAGIRAAAKTGGSVPDNR